MHALGRILEYMITGEHPSGDDDSRSGGPRTMPAWRRCRRGLKQIILKATAANPEDRYPNAGALAAAVRAHQRWVDVSQRRALSGLLLACLLLVAGIVFAGQRTAMAALSGQAAATDDKLSDTTAQLGKTRAELSERGETLDVMERRLRHLQTQLNGARNEAAVTTVLLEEESELRQRAVSEAGWLRRQVSKEKARADNAESELAVAGHVLELVTGEFKDAHRDLEATRQELDAARSRAESESQRAESERQRAESERERADAEKTRADAEEQRATSEHTRAQTEQARADAEGARADAATSARDGIVRP